MNCRQVQHQLFAEGDSALDNSQRAALEGHVAQCADCRRIREDLTTVLTVWRLDTVKVVVPDAEREWQAVRRKIRGGVAAGSEPAAPARRNVFAWLTIPLGAAAALAVALFVSRPDAPAPHVNHPIATPQVARADAIEAPGNNASTMVFVDDQSRWLIVWASDAPKSG